MTIEEAVKQVVATSPAYVTELGVRLVDQVGKHLEAEAALVSIISEKLSLEESAALFDCLLDLFVDQLDEEMVEAVALIKDRVSYV